MELVLVAVTWCGTWDAFIDVATVASAFAALGAVWFAYRAVHETRELRREDRLARLPELVVAVGESLLDFSGSLTGRSHEWTYPIAVGRLRAALAFVDEPLPECWKLATWGTGTDAGGDPIRDLLTTALHELANLGRSGD